MSCHASKSSIVTRGVAARCRVRRFVPLALLLATTASGAPYHAEPILYRTLGKVRPGRKTLAARSTGRASAAIVARGANAAATSGST